MASRQELLQSIQPGMKLYKSFFLKIYGYELTWPGFAEVALSKLQDVGCTKARDYYRQIIGSYERNQENIMRDVTEWYRQQCERYGKVMNELRRTERMSNSELLTSLENLINAGL